MKKKIKTLVLLTQVFSYIFFQKAAKLNETIACKTIKLMCL